ncbi:MAG TPA: pitrilysin family protein [Hyphomicrobiaceae bacterium]|nr:pitrilysin family protein [Hyphomicrobiaceae bacterium]
MRSFPFALRRFGAAHLLAITMAVVAAVASVLVPTPSHAMKIQELTTKSGIKLWLVEEHAVPLVAMRFSFAGGATQDPENRPGIAHFMSGMMDEGAGDLTSVAFQARMEELAMRLSFEAAKDSFYGSFETLSDYRRESAALLKLAVNAPRFDADAIERVRRQIASSLAYAAKNPESVVSERWMSEAYKGHPYGRPTKGTPDTVGAITRDDLVAYRKRIFARDNLNVVVVGDITSAEASAMVDDIFGALPAKSDLVKVADVAPKAAEKLVVVDMPVPQSVARFGSGAMMRKDKDFIPAFVLNHILGGGGFSSRLMEEVREKRGLAYSVYSYLQPLDHTSMFMGGVATKNEEMAQSLDVIRGELKRLATEGPTVTELDNAKSNLIGAFALRFDTNAKIANQLLYFMEEDLGAGYVDTRNKEVAAVTIDDVRRVAKRLFAADDLFVTIVGRPKGLKAGG